jgi:hypothetical protein
VYSILCLGVPCFTLLVHANDPALELLTETILAPRLNHTESKLDSELAEERVDWSKITCVFFMMLSSLYAFVRPKVISPNLQTTHPAVLVFLLRVDSKEC